MEFIRPDILKMQGYVPGEHPAGDGWVKLNQNENPYPPSPRVAEAMAAAARELQHYPDSSSAGVRRAAAAAVGTTPERVLVANGSDEMLRILFQSCTGAGDEAVAFYPSYTYYKTLAEIQGARYRLIDFNPDYSLPEKLRLENAKLVFLPVPNAPSGTMFSEADLARLCAATGGLVVVDEAYADFSGFSAIPLLDKYENLFVVRTLSKSYSLAGLRVGLGFGREELLAELDKVRDYYNLDRAAQAGAEAALRDQEYFNGNLAKVVATRARLERELAELAEQVWPSRANFVLARFVKPTAAEIFRRLRERKVLVRHFSAPRLEDCLRISVGTDREIDILLERLREIVGR